MKKLAMILGLALSVMCGQAYADVLINEFHYDNAGADVGEFVEIAVLQGTALSDVTIELYNGSTGASYDNINAGSAAVTAGATGVAINGLLYDLFVWNPSSIQNGAPDGIAASSLSGRLDFISYEGAFTATGGIADLVGSTDVGVTEGGGTAIGSSISLINGDWVVTDVATSGGANVIPEPGSFLVLTVLGLAATRRRR